MCIRQFLLVASCAVFLSFSLRADDSLAALPGQNSNAANVSVFGINPLGTLNSFTAGDGAYEILSLPDGSKNYVISKSGTNTIMSTDKNFQTLKLVANLQTVATAAAITPDGTRLVVAAGTLHVFDTSKDTEVVSGGISTGTTVYDVALSLDGQFAYALGTTTSSGSQVNQISLKSNLSVTSQGILGTAQGITVGFNGLVYVTTQNQINEFDPTTLAPTTGGKIGVNALPGSRLVFTPDGKYALTVNQTPVTGSSILLIDLTAHTVANFVPNNGVVFDTLLPTNSTTVFAYSSQDQSLYQLGIGNSGSIAIGPPVDGGVASTFVEGVAVSDELPFAGNTTAHYLFVATAGTLYRVDLTLGPQITGQTVLPNSGFSALQYVALPSTNPSEVLLPYGDKQTVAPNGTSHPLTVRALDTAGKPVVGATITFVASSNTASLSTTTATTGANGFAETVLTAPPTAGTVTVTASDGKHPYGFTVTVGSPTLPNSGNLTLVAGQGQMLPSNANTGEPNSGSPLMVALTDVNGKPIANSPVTFTINNSALGTLSATGLIGGASAVVQTNSQGLATINYQTTFVPVGLGSQQAQITAKGNGTNTLTFYETTYPFSQQGPAQQPTVQFFKPQIGTTLTGGAGTTITAAFTAVIRDSTGEPLPNVSVHSCVPQAGQSSKGGITPSTCGVPAAGSLVPFGTCNDPTGEGALSDATGKISCDLVLNGVVGSGTIGAEYGYAFVTPNFPLEITPGPPGVIRILGGNNQTGKPGQQLPLALLAQITDQFNNVVPPGTPVTWSVLSSGVPATLTPPTSSATDPNGEASTMVTLGSTAGVAVIQISAGNVSASFSATVLNPAAGIQVVSGNNQSTLISTNFAAPLVVEVVDAQGNPVSGAPVTFAITTGSASIGTASTSTNSSGQASTTITAGSSPGSIVITATASTFSVTFTLTANPLGPQNIIFVNGASFLLQSNCPSPGCVAPGEVVTIEGTGFATGVQGVMSGTSLAGPLPTTLAGASITFNGVAAPIFYIANVNGMQSMSIQVPFETQPGNATIVFTGAGGGSANLNVTVNPFAPGIFTTAYGNQIVAVAVRPDGSYVSPTNPAHLGETIYLFVTGLGATSPAASTGAQGASQAVTGTVITGLNNGGVPHGTVYYAPGLVGVYIVPMDIPATITTGPSQPVGLVLVDPSGTKYFAGHANIPIVAQ